MLKQELDVKAPASLSHATIPVEASSDLGATDKKAAKVLEWMNTAETFQAWEKAKSRSMNVEPCTLEISDMQMSRFRRASNWSRESKELIRKEAKYLTPKNLCEFAGTVYADQHFTGRKGTRRSRYSFVYVIKATVEANKKGMKNRRKKSMNDLLIEAKAESHHLRRKIKEFQDHVQSLNGEIEKATRSRQLLPSSPDDTYLSNELTGAFSCKFTIAPTAANMKLMTINAPQHIFDSIIDVLRRK